MDESFRAVHEVVACQCPYWTLLTLCLLNMLFASDATVRFVRLTTLGYFPFHFCHSGMLSFSKRYLVWMYVHPSYKILVRPLGYHQMMEMPMIAEIAVLPVCDFICGIKLLRFADLLTT